MAYGTVYLVFLWAWWGATGEWVYAALNWAHPASLGGYVALPLLLVSPSGMAAHSGRRLRSQRLPAHHRGRGPHAAGY